MRSFRVFMLDVLLNVIVFLFCFFLNGVFGQQSWRNAFLGSEAHAFQHFGLAYYTAVTVRELVEGFERRRALIRLVGLISTTFLL